MREFDHAIFKCQSDNALCDLSWFQLFITHYYSFVAIQIIKCASRMLNIDSAVKVLCVVS